MSSARHVLTLSCADRRGIVHAVSAGLLDLGGNILENAQFTEPDSGRFCMRTLVETAEACSSLALFDAVVARLGAGSAALRVRPESHRPRVMILVSRTDHCLVDLLYRWHAGLLPIDVVAIASNHDDCRTIAEPNAIPFHWLPVAPDTKADQERQLLRLVDELGVELVVLARYMQVLSDALCERLRGRAINIHHSFLPGFRGARPYHQAHQRGVKLVGATAHFVSPELDEGPIIEQDVVRVGHRHTAEDLVALGRDVERLVLARAVKLWAEDRLFVVGDKTVVLE